MSLQRSQSLIVRELVDITVDRLAQFRDAVGKGDMAAAFNIDRLNHGEEPLEPSSDLIASRLFKELDTMGRSPFNCDVRSLPSFRKSGKTLNPINENLPLDSEPKRPRTDGQSTFKVYYRQFRYTTKSLRADLELYKAKFPGDEVWARVCLKDLESFDDQPVFLHYGGMTTRSAIIRGLEDGRTEYRRWSNWLEMSSVQDYDTFEYDTGIITTALEVRDRDDLQDLERCIIQACLPSLNSARGGIRHSLSPHPLAPTQPNTYILERKTEPWPYGPKVEKLMRDSRSFYATVPAMYTGSAITSQAFSSLLRHIQRGSVYLGVLPTLAIGSDITKESFFSSSLEMGYSDRLTGPGPRVTDQARLNALGLNHRHPGDINISLGSFIDFWALTLVKDILWIPMLHTIRMIKLLKPVLIRPCSSRLCNLFVEDTFETILAPVTDTNRKISLNFWAGVSPANWNDLKTLVNPDHQQLKWTESQSTRWRELVGELYIVPVGGFWVLCLTDFDGGLLKYDPRFTEIIGAMKKVIGLKGVVAEEVIMAYIEQHGNPSGQIGQITALRTRIELEYDRRGLKTELSKLKIRYQEMHTCVSSRRTEAMWERQIEMEVERGTHQDDAQSRALLAKQRLASTRSGLFKALGPPDSAVRQAQFEAASTLWTVLVGRGLENTAVTRPPRFYDHDDSQWQSWWLRAKEGHELSYSAFAYNGQSTRYMNDAEKQIYVKRLYKGRPTNYTVVSWLSSSTKDGALLRLASHQHFKTGYRDRDHRIVTCDDCDDYTIGTANCKHRCLKGGDTSDKDLLQTVTPTADGLKYVSLVFPHDLLDHPLHGYANWPELWDGDLEENLSTYLDRLGLAQSNARDVILQNWTEVKDFIPKLEDVDAGYIVHLKTGADKGHKLSMAIDRYLKARSVQFPPAGGSAPAKSLWDDSDPYTYGSGTPALIQNMMKTSNAMNLVSCTRSPPYGFSANRVDAKFYTHQCSTLYEPLLAATGQSLTEYLAANGNKAITHKSSSVVKKIKSFYDLRPDIQRRIWLAISRDKDPLHGKSAKRLLTWKVKSLA